MTPLFQWTVLPRPELQKQALRELVPIALRSAAWAIALCVALILALRLLVPDSPLPLLPILVACVTLPGSIGLLSMMPVDKNPGTVVFTDRGYRPRRRWLFEWKSGLGWSWLGTPPEEILLVSRGGTALRLPAPPSVEQPMIERAMRERLPSLTESQRAEYSVPVRYTLQDTVLLSLASFGNALLVGFLAPWIMALFPGRWIMLVLGALCLPASVLVWLACRERYPQYGRLRLTLAGIIWFLTSSMAMPFTAGFILRAYYGPYLGT